MKSNKDLTNIIISLPDNEETRITEADILESYRIEEEEEEEPVGEEPGGIDEAPNDGGEPTPATAQDIIDMVETIDENGLKEVAYTLKVTDKGASTLAALTYGFRRVPRDVN